MLVFVSNTQHIFLKINEHFARLMACIFSYTRMETRIYQAIESCRRSAISCKECAAALKGSEMENCIKICLECAMICELCVSLGENKSIYFQKSLELAMDACLNCISTCENNASAPCMKCAWQCRKSTVDFLSLIE